MKKIFKLTQNELVKMLKKKSTIILVLILVLLSGAVPFISKMSDYDYSSTEDYIHHIERTEQRIIELKNENDDSLEIMSEIINCEIELDMYQLMYDENIPYSDWRNDYYMNVTNNRYISKFLNYIDVERFPELAHKFLGHVPEVIDLVGTDYTIDDIRNIANQYDKIADGYLKTIKENDYNVFLKTQKEDLEEQIVALNDEKKDLEQQVAQNPDDTEIATSLKMCKSNILISNHKIKLIDAQAKNVNFTDEKNVKAFHSMLNQSEQYIFQISEIKLTEEEFNLDPNYSYEYQSYEDYSKKFEKDIATAVNNFQLITYGIEHNIPSYEWAYNTRNSIMGILDMIILLCIVISVFAGGIVSKEYSTGTIRLLLIRPASRNKILISKLLSLLITSIGLVLISFITLTITSIITYGTADLAYPILSIRYGDITEHNIFLYLIPKILASFAPIIFAISLAFAISTITKSTALSVGLSVAVIAFSMPFTLFLGQYYNLKFILAYLPTTYISFAEFLVSQDSYMMDVLSTLSVNISAGFGAFVLLTYSAVFLAISFLVFKKRDILN